MYVNSAAQSLARGGCTVTLLSGLAEASKVGSLGKNAHSRQKLERHRPYNRPRARARFLLRGRVGLTAALRSGSQKHYSSLWAKGPGSRGCSRPDPTPPFGGVREGAGTELRAIPGHAPAGARSPIRRAAPGGAFTGAEPRAVPSLSGPGGGNSGPPFGDAHGGAQSQDPRLAQPPGRLPGLSFSPALGPEHGRGRPRAPHPTSPELGAAGAGGRGRAEGGRGRAGAGAAPWCLRGAARTRAHRRRSARRGYRARRGLRAASTMLSRAVCRIRTAAAAASRATRRGPRWPAAAPHRPAHAGPAGSRTPACGQVVGRAGIQCRRVRCTAA